MLIFDGLDFTTRTIKLRPRQVNTCLMCSKSLASLTRLEMSQLLDQFDYSSFCGVSNYNDKSLTVNLLDQETERVTCDFYNKNIYSVDKETPHLLIDVRPKCQFNICSLDRSISKMKICLFFESLEHKNYE